MRTFYALAFSCAAIASQAQLTVQTLNSFEFAPAMATMDLGQTVTFVVSGSHTATQVSEETWLANSNTPLPGGFDFGSGSHVYTPTAVDTIFFVCQPHAGMGMKGMIVVENTTGIAETGSAALFRIYPNPVADQVNIETAGTSQFVLIDVQGREVIRRTVNANDRIDVSQLPEGNYSALLKDQKGDPIGTQRLTIAR